MKINELSPLWNLQLFHEDGHYKLGLPWRDKNASIPNNLPLAHSRLQNLRKKLIRNPNLHEMYKSTVNYYIEKGYATEVTNSEMNTNCVCYLSHHPVINEHKPGKVRDVFDCAATYQSRSLNSELLQGLDLMNSLVGVLLRFRKDKIGIVADIEAMFRQVMEWTECLKVSLVA